MVGIRRRNAEWAIEIARWIVTRNCLGMLYSPLNVADRIQILIYTIAVARSKRLLQVREFIDNRIEQAGPLLKRGAAFGRRTLFPKEVFENNPRVSLRRKRRRRRGPRKIVLIDAGVT